VVVKWISSTYLPESSKSQINLKPDIVISMLRKVLKCGHTDEEYTSVVFVLPLHYDSYKLRL